MLIRQVGELTRFDPTGPVRHPVAEGTHCKTALWCLEAGQEIHPHVHAGDHVWTVVEGEGWFLTEKDAHPVEKGSVVFAPAGEAHGMRAGTQLAFVSVSAG
ncbi:MAG TPA: cupin domain-containing protein [Candidatus Deferrimicrobiaceae bacterium]|jgi:quercetin dioxygenase-like cupin family protein